MRYDWQAYLDGSLDPEQRELHDAALQADPAASAELDALRALRSCIKQAVTSGVVVPRITRRTFRLVPLVAVAVAALAVTIAVLPRPEPPVALGPDSMRFDTSAAVEMSPRTANLVTSTAWLQKQTGFEVPALALGKRAQFKGAMYGDGWGCIYFEEDGQMYHLYVRKEAPQLETGMRIRLDCEGEFFEGKGIGWRANGLSYYLKSKASRNLKRIAAHIAPQTSRA